MVRVVQNLGIITLSSYMDKGKFKIIVLKPNYLPKAIKQVQTGLEYSTG
jgi:hypothetical protein